MPTPVARWIWAACLGAGTFSAFSAFTQSWTAIPLSTGAFHQISGLADPGCAPAGFLGKSTAGASWTWFGLQSGTTPLVCDSFPDITSLMTCGTRGQVPFLNTGIFYWIGTEGDGVFGHSADTVIHFSPNNTPMPDGTVRQVVQRGDTLWMATAGGLARAHANQWKSWTLANGLSSSHVTDLAFFPDGAIGFSSINGGLTILRGDTVSDILNNQNSWLPDNTLTSIEVTTDGNIWLSSTTAGIILVQQEIPSFFQVQNGKLPSNGIRQLSAISYPAPGILAATETTGILWLDATGVQAHWPGGANEPFSPEEILWIRGATADFPFHVAAGLHQIYVYPVSSQSISDFFLTQIHHGLWEMPFDAEVRIMNQAGQICFSQTMKAGAQIPRPGPTGWYFLQVKETYYRLLWLD